MKWCIYDVRGTIYRVSGVRAEFYTGGAWYTASVSPDAISKFHLARLVARNVVFK